MDTENVINKKRRNLIKYLLIGGGTLIVGKIFSPSIIDFFSSPAPIEVEKDFGNFKVSNDKKELIISDKAGEEILIIDK